MVKIIKQAYRSLKCPLKSVIKTNENLLIINNIVIKINLLRNHLLFFTKLYFIYLYDNNLKFPIIDRAFYLCIVRVLTISKNERRPFKINVILFNDIQIFYNNFYKKLRYDDINDILDVTSYRSIIYYMITDIITDLENNIHMRFYNHVKNFVDCVYNKKIYINRIKTLDKNIEYKKKLINKRIKMIKNVVNKIYDVTDLGLLKRFFKNNKIFEKEAIKYDIKCTPQDYLKAMIYMNKVCDENNYHSLNVFPLKRQIIPGHIRFDTESLVDIFIKNPINKKLYKKSGGVSKYKNVIWNEIFKTDKKIFGLGDNNIYKFNGSIQTDGYSISILHFKNVKNTISKELYIDQLEQDKLQQLLKLMIVAIDPNKDDLIYCGSGSREEKDFTIFRYTQNQRSKETCKRKYKKILEQEKLKNFICNHFNDELSIKLNINKCEEILSKYNSKTNDFEKFSDYVKNKNVIYIELKKFYEQVLWRKNRYSSCIKRIQSDRNMIKNFEKIGKSNETFIAFGDWSQKEQMKFKEPTKGKSFRNLFRKAGYQVYLIDEYKTSKQCCNCKKMNAINEKFLKIKSPRPWRKNTEILCNGLVKCTTCKTMFNRDTNSVVNIRNITLNALNNVNRPDFLCR